MYKCGWCGEGPNKEQGVLVLHEYSHWHRGCWISYQEARAGGRVH